MTQHCDLETGLCMPSKLEDGSVKTASLNQNLEFTYIGDPMCSWCWGISRTLETLQQYCTHNGIKFSIVVGGLRPGGGDEWNASFKSFLRKEWQYIQQVTQQPFSFLLLDRPLFNYDTEPACRAVVTARQLLKPDDVNDQNLLSFFSSIQEKFYVGGEDPAQLEFYRALVEQQPFSFSDFAQVFESDEARQNAIHDFQLNRSWGVRGFPSFVLREGNDVKIIGSGYIQIDPVIQEIDLAIKRNLPN